MKLFLRSLAPALILFASTAQAAGAVPCSAEIRQRLSMAMDFYKEARTYYGDQEKILGDAEWSNMVHQLHMVRDDINSCDTAEAKIRYAFLHFHEVGRDYELRDVEFEDGIDARGNVLSETDKASTLRLINVILDNMYDDIFSLFHYGYANTNQDDWESMRDDLKERFAKHHKTFPALNGRDR